MYTTKYNYHMPVLHASSRREHISEPTDERGARVPAVGHVKKGQHQLRLPGIRHERARGGLRVHTHGRERMRVELGSSEA